MVKKSYCLVVFFVAVLLCCSSAHGQATGGFSGTVTDKSGAVISGAKVTATSQGTGIAREANTDEVGHYVINLLHVGVYTLRVESAGFQAAEIKDLKLQVDEQRELDFTLAPGTVSTSVEVSATQVAVETTNPTLGQVITSQQVAQLPLNGRDFVQLATLTPGTTQETSPASFFNGGPSSEVSARGTVSLSVGGSRVNSTDWLLDGSDNNELTSGGIAILANIDSIQEFKVLTYNYSAEYGTRAGPTVLITSKSGSNDFHGTLYEFLRNTSLDAKSFFATSTEKFNLNQFGGGIGGPLRKNKTFFFIDGEQKYQRQGKPFTGLVPSDAMKAGDFSADPFGNPVSGIVVTNPNLSGAANPDFQCQGSANGPPTPVVAGGGQMPGVNCNKIPGASALNNPAYANGLINPIGQALMNLYPEPNANNPNLGYNFTSQPVRKLDETKFDIRLDHNFSGADSMFARFSYDQATSYVPGGADGFAEQAPFASNQGIINHGRNVSIGETHVFSSAAVNQVSIGYNRIFNYITSQGTDTCKASTIVPGGIPGANLNCSPTEKCSGSSCGLTSTQLDGGYWSLGDRGYSPFQGGTNVYSIADSFDMIRGKHDIHVGGSLRFNQMNVRAIGFQDGYWVISGAWTGSPPADLLMGLSSIRIHDQNFNGDVTGRRWLIFRPYVQDDWRVNRDLTLNLGVAWAIVPPVTEAAGRLSNLIPTTGDLIVGGNGGIAMQWSAFEPRIGLAWKVLGSDKTAFRAGYGIFHDSAWSMGAQGLWQNPPFAAESFGLQFGGCTTAAAACASIAGQTPNVGTGALMGLSDGFPVITSPPGLANFQGNWTAENTDLKQGMVQQFNANIERQIPGDVVLTVGYAGARSIHILNYGNNLNVGSPSACGTTPGYTLGCGPGGSAFPPPYPEFVIQSINDYGKASYNSLQIKAETKSSRYGLYALIGYTYSHTYDTGYTDGLGTPIGAPYFPLPNWKNLDWARSQINLDHNFTASVIYDLPFGRGKKFGHDWNNATNALLGNWQVTVIEKITSGFPIFLINSNNGTVGVGSGVNFYNNGNNYNRPDQICNPNSGFQQSLAMWFNTSCFASAAPGELGNANRAPIAGPDFVNTDFSVIKRFALPWENMGLDFRAEIFNLFNHAQFGLPGIPGLPNDISSPVTFGKISYTVNNPRLVQFGLKLTF